MATASKKRSQTPTAPARSAGDGVRHAPVDAVYAQFEALLSQITDEINQCRARVDAYKSKAGVDDTRHRSKSLPPESTSASPSRPSPAAAARSAQDETPAGDVQLQYRQWTAHAAHEWRLRLALALHEMLEQQMAGSSPTAPTVQGVLAAASQQRLPGSPRTASASLADASTLPAGARPLARTFSKILKESPPLAADEPVDQPSMPVIKTLRRGYIDPARLPSLRQQPLGAAQRPTEILLPAEVIQQLEAVVDLDARQVGLVDRLHLGLMALPGAAPETQKAMRTFVKAVMQAAPPETTVDALGDIFKPDVMAEPSAVLKPDDVDLLVAQLLSPALNAPEYLGPLSDLLRTIADAALLPWTEPGARLFDPAVIATLLSTTTAPALAAPWMRPPASAMPAKHAAAWSAAYTSLASARSVPFAVVKSTTQHLLAADALQNTAYVVFLQALVLRHDDADVGDVLEAFYHGHRLFADAGLATTEPTRGLRLLDTYAADIGAHELRLLLQPRIEPDDAGAKGCSQEEHEGEQAARRQARHADEAEEEATRMAEAAEAAAQAAEEAAREERILLSDSPVVKTYEVSLDPAILQTLASSGTARAANPAGRLGGESWSGLSSLGGVVHTLRSYVLPTRPNDTLARRARTPPPAPPALPEALVAGPAASPAQAPPHLPTTSSDGAPGPTAGPALRLPGPPLELRLNAVGSKAPRQTRSTLKRHNKRRKVLRAAGLEAAGEKVEAEGGGGR